VRETEFPDARQPAKPNVGGIFLASHWTDGAQGETAEIQHARH
jgi:hypothetical protein